MMIYEKITSWFKANMRYSCNRHKIEGRSVFIAYFSTLT